MNGHLFQAKRFNRVSTVVEGDGGVGAGAGGGKGMGGEERKLGAAFSPR